MYFKYEHLHNATSEALPNSIAGRLRQSERSVANRNQVLLEVGRDSHARTSSGVFLLARQPMVCSQDVSLMERLSTRRSSIIMRNSLKFPQPPRMQGVRHIAVALAVFVSLGAMAIIGFVPQLKAAGPVQIHLDHWANGGSPQTAKKWVDG